MKLRIIILSISILFISIASNAQTSFAILGGVNFQNLNGKDFDERKLNNDLVVGFHAGVNLLIPVAPDFYFNPGLIYSVKGAENENNGITSTYKINYLEMPLNLTYRAQVGAGYVIFGFGPYLAYAVGGNGMYKGGNVSYERDIEFQKSIESGDDLDMYLRPFDAGANIFFGYELQAGLFFQLNSQLGLLNIYPENNRDNNNETVLRNTGFGLSLGFRF